MSIYDDWLVKEPGLEPPMVPGPAMPPPHRRVDPRYMVHPGMPPHEHPGPCCFDPDAVINPYEPGCPNPVPNKWHYPVPPPPPHHFEDRFVLKKQLNQILRSIAEADIFVDKSENGTTIKVGGIKAGTKLDKMTFSEFIEKLLYTPVEEDEPTDPDAYVKFADLEAYVKTSSLSTTLADYVTATALELLLNGYAKNEDIEDFVTEAQVTTAITAALTAYVSQAELTTKLNDYIKETDLDEKLGSYVKTSTMTATLGDYVTTGKLEDEYSTTEQIGNKLADYAKSEDVAETYAAKEELNSYVTNTALTQTLRDYTTDAELDASKVYPEGKRTAVVNAIGGFAEGDSLEGMTIADIIEKLLTTQVDPGP